MTFPEPDASVRERAVARQARLTKPPGSLGALERLAVDLAGLQGRDRPAVDRVRIAVFAADHGVVGEGVSAFPQAVTTAMVTNFVAGGAAISVMAETLGATLEVIDVGTATPVTGCDAVIDARQGAGTANMVETEVMTAEQFEGASAAGREAAQRAARDGAELFIPGEMGIGNTTAAAAVAASLLDVPAADVVGAGTGLVESGIRHKAEVIERALTRHGRHPGDPERVLRTVGGFEVVAMAAAMTAAAEYRMPVLVDGFIATAAALAAVRREPALRPWLIFAHRSMEAGHGRLLAALQAEPLLDLGLRLGEGSGAAVAVPLLRMACATHNRMATFEEAGIGGASS